uniref:CYP4M38 n=1 Tax=Chilo suppressalis TaxID=168631 RepID=X5DQR3_CHISP|nr:CYP4M38 [Chilo suppressalis]
MLFIILISTVCFLVFLHVLFNCHEKARLVRSIPGPDNIFLIGNALEFLATPVEIFGLTRKAANKWKIIYRFWAFNLAAVNVFTPEHVEKIISTTKFNSKSILYSFMRPWLQDGLLLSDGAKWQQRRKILTPTFHFNILQRFCVIIEENSRRMVEMLNNSAGEKVDVVPLMSEFTLNSICETAMGTRFSEEMADKGESYKAAIHSIGKGLVQRVTRIMLFSDLIFNLSAFGREQIKSIQIVQNFTKKVIKDRKANIEQYGAENLDDMDNNEYNMNNKRKRTAMLDLLIQAQKVNLIDDQGIQEEVDTFMFEGHDTTACGLMYCLMLLANHKDIQDKIFEELFTIFGNSDISASYDDLSKMRYLECCIKESLRLYPPVPFISRQLTESTDLGGYKIPSDVFCHIHIYDLHRREELFPDPLKFDPDRFLPENCIGRHPYAYIPFSAGPRNCIGQKFAMMEMKSAISAILRRFEIYPVTRPWDLRIAADLVLRSTEPIYVIFEKRNTLSSK